MYAQRLTRLRERFAENDLGALLVTSLPNIYYLSGFTGSTAVVLLTAERSYFITDGRYTVQVAEQVDPAYTCIDNTGRKLVGQVFRDVPELAAVRRIGFEAAHTNVSALSQYRDEGGWEFVPAGAWTEELRMVKDEAEIERIRLSVELNERLWEAVLATIGPETTEQDLAAEIYYRALKMGSQGVSFAPIVASGERSAKPHAGFTPEKLVPGTPLTFDLGLRLDGYCSDMTRTVFYKDCPPKWAEIYGIVKQAKDDAMAAVKPGATGAEIDGVARRVIADAGYGANFNHSLGHGVGIEVHEAPRLASVYDKPVKLNHVITNEPGIYLPGEGGVRIEDIFVVRENGAENLNVSPTDVRVVG